MNESKHGYEQGHESSEKRSILDRLGSIAKKHPGIYSSLLLLGTMGASKEAFGADKVDKKVPDAPQHQVAKYEGEIIEAKDADDYEKAALAYLDGKIPDPSLWELKRSKNFDEAERSRRIEDALKKNQISIEGFDKHTKMSEKDVLSTIRSMPPGWQANFRKIEHADKDEEIDKQYGAQLKRSATLIHPAKLNTIDRTLTFYPDAEKMDFKYYRHTIIHEGSHMNEWYFNDFLTRREKIILLMAIVKRLGEKDRFMAPEVEKLQNSDPQEELYLKCGEYFAEITANSLDGGKFVSSKDDQIVKWLLHKMDPKYDNAKLVDLEKKIVFVPEVSLKDKGQVAGLIKNE